MQCAHETLFCYFSVLVFCLLGYCHIAKANAASMSNCSDRNYEQPRRKRNINTSLGVTPNWRLKDYFTMMRETNERSVHKLWVQYSFVENVHHKNIYVYPIFDVMYYLKICHDGTCCWTILFDKLIVVLFNQIYMQFVCLMSLVVYLNAKTINKRLSGFINILLLSQVLRQASFNC